MTTCLKVLGAKIILDCHRENIFQITRLQLKKETQKFVKKS